MPFTHPRLLVHGRPCGLRGVAGPKVIFDDGDAFAGEDDTGAGVNLVSGGGATRGGHPLLIASNAGARRCRDRCAPLDAAPTTR